MSDDDVTTEVEVGLILLMAGAADDADLGDCCLSPVDVEA